MASYTHNAQPAPAAVVPAGNVAVIPAAKRRKAESGSAQPEITGVKAPAGAPRDREFLGIHAYSLGRLQVEGMEDPKFLLDPYGSLKDKTTTISRADAIEAVRLARARFAPMLDTLSGTVEARETLKRADHTPPLWTYGHVAFFYESNFLDVLGTPKEAVDGGLGGSQFFNGEPRKLLFDSIVVNRPERVASPLWGDPSTTDVLAYAEAVYSDVDRYLELCETDNADNLHPVDTHLLTYVVIHDLWHSEDLLCTMQKLGFADPTPRFPRINPEAYPFLTDPTQRPQVTVDTVRAIRTEGTSVGAACRAAMEGSESPWVAIPAGEYRLGPAPGELPFTFDQEKWGHTVKLDAFEIARTPVTNGQFAAFVDGGGYEKRALWSHEGWRWRLDHGANQPTYWHRPSRASAGEERGNADGEGSELGGSEGAGASAGVDTNVSNGKCGCAPSGSAASGKDEGWVIQRFDQRVPLAELADHPVAHLTYWEAEAYAVWAGHRLPTEAEWEAACFGADAAEATRYPWGNQFFSAGEGAKGLAKIGEGQSSLGTASVSEFAGGDTASGCRQMCGNVWEWTATTFYPWPGYVLDFPYRENAAPWFGFNKVVKGGSWTTSALLAHPKHRNYYHPDERREVPVGLRLVRGGAAPAKLSLLPPVALTQTTPRDGQGGGH